MQSRDQRITSIAQQIQELTAELSELLSLRDQDSLPAEATTADQTPPNTAFLHSPSEEPPIGVGATIELINRRDPLFGEIGQIVKVTAQQFAIRLMNYPNNPRPTYRYKDKVKRVRIIDTRSQ